MFHANSVSVGIPELPPGSPSFYLHPPLPLLRENGAGGTPRGNDFLDSFVDDKLLVAPIKAKSPRQQSAGSASVLREN
ncbi:hypothetical protein [Neorhizobium galegae]|uniref:hypothetical protein n=1 Tax=Neorhizobium galegae TaxID=399 RepID=UPI00155DF496|nr:hypothetical protein [Neorhizobium galegae]